MKDDPTDGASRAEAPRSASRRGFFQGMGALASGALAAPLTAGAAELPPGPAGSGRGRRLRLYGTKRATGPLAIHSNLTLTKAPRLSPDDLNLPTMQHDPPPELLPSTRQRLVGAIRNAPGGLQLLKQAARNDPTQHEPEEGAERSEEQKRILRDQALSRAYAQGVTLTETECVYLEDTWIEAPPVLYYTYYGTLNPDMVKWQYCYTSTGGRQGDLPLIQFSMQNPGEETEYLTYCLELYMGSVTLADFRIELNGTEVHFSPTSDGTWVLIAEIPGSGDRAGHTNLLELFPTRDLYCFFTWLNVISL